MERETERDGVSTQAEAGGAVVGWVRAGRSGWKPLC